MMAGPEVFELGCEGAARVWIVGVAAKLNRQNEKPGEARLSY